MYCQPATKNLPNGDVVCARTKCLPAAAGSQEVFFGSAPWFVQECSRMALLQRVVSVIDMRFALLVNDNRQKKQEMEVQESYSKLTEKYTEKVQYLENTNRTSRIRHIFDLCDI